MFALWYLSLAVDELRKHYGWTFFDIFYKTNKSDANSLDNKSANIVPAQKLEPDSPKPTPKITPLPDSKPAQAPAAPGPVSKPESPRIPKPIQTPAPAPAPAPVPVPVPAPVAKSEEPPTPKPAPAVQPPKPFTTPLVPNAAPETVVAKTEDKPVTPPKSLKRNSNDSFDRKLMQVSKAKENGESLKNNIKNATMDFLSGEANTHTLIKR